MLILHKDSFNHYPIGICEHTISLHPQANDLLTASYFIQYIILLLNVGVRAYGVKTYLLPPIYCLSDFSSVEFPNMQSSFLSNNTDLITY